MRFTWLVYHLVVLVIPVQAQFDWPMVSGGSSRTSWAITEQSLSPPFDETVSYNNISGTDLAVRGDTLYVGQSGQPNTIVAFDMLTGTELWTFEIEGSSSVIGCTPSVSDSFVFCGGQHGLGLFAVNRFTGIEVWRREIGSLFANNPISDGERVYVIRDSLYCFDTRTGNTVWNYPAGGTSLTPSVDESSVYFCTGGLIYSLDKFSGNEQWVKPTTRSGETVSILDGQLIISSTQSIISLRKSDGSSIWTHYVTDGTVPSLGQGAMAVSNDIVAFDIWENQNLEAELRVLDVNTGMEIWRTTFDTIGVYTPTIANNVVYAVEWYRANLWGYDAACGDVLYSATGGYTKQPIVANHALFVKRSGGVIAFRNSVSSMTARDPMPEIRLLSYPNPSSRYSDLSFSLPDKGWFGLILYDIQGHTIWISNRFCESAGEYTISVPVANLPSGIYPIRTRWNNTVVTDRLIVVH